MSNKAIVKAKAPVAKPAFKAPTPTSVEAPAKKTRSREKVLKEYTVAELEKLVGRDTKIGVSFKSLKAVVLSKRSGEILEGL